MLSFIYGCRKTQIGVTDLSYIMLDLDYENRSIEEIERYRKYFVDRDNDKYKKFVFKKIQHKIRNFIKLSPLEINKIRMFDEEEKIKLIEILNKCVEVLLEYNNY